MGSTGAKKELENELQKRGYDPKLVLGKGFGASENVPIRTNRRHYWDPRKDESGNVMGWTTPLPGDPLRFTLYLRNGFMPTDPEGHTAPPSEFFRRFRPTAASKVINTQPVAVIEVAGNGHLTCPICQQGFEDKAELITHITRHKSKPRPMKAKKRGKKKKRGNPKNGG